MFFPLGSRISIEPTAGFRWLDHSMVGKIGGGLPPFGRNDAKPNPTNPSGPGVNISDLHYRDVVAGFTLSFAS